MQSEHHAGTTAFAGSIVAWVAACVLGLFTPSAWSQTYSLTLLPSDIPGAADPSLKALARGISGDGNVIVGSSNTILTPDEKPYVWRRVGNQWTRSDLPVLNGAGRAVAASFDGSTIVGSAGNFASFTTHPGTPAVWRTATTSPTLETPLLTAGPNGQPLRGVFNGVSASGSRVFGFARPLDTWGSVYVYDAGSSPVALTGFAQTTGAYPASNTMSADGRRATHFQSPGSGGASNASIWTEGAGSAALPVPAGGSNVPRTTAISGDGRTVVGFLAGPTPVANDSGLPVIWRDGVFRVLVRPNNAISTFVAGSDTTGRVLVGAAGNNLDLVNFTTNMSSVGSAFAAIWIDGQAFSLATYLTSNGVNLGTLTPILTSGVSADGSTVVGVATRPIGTTTEREYVSFIATIPTPGTVFGMSLCVVFAARRRR